MLRIRTMKGKVKSVKDHSVIVNDVLKICLLTIRHKGDNIY